MEKSISRLAKRWSSSRGVAGYVSPPGVTNQTDRIGAALQFGSQQINEQSLRLLARDLRTGERAEASERFAHLRFHQGRAE